MTRKDVINQVLNDFLGDEVDESYEDCFLGLTLDEDEREILANAIDEALEKYESKT